MNDRERGHRILRGSVGGRVRAVVVTLVISALLSLSALDVVAVRLLWLLLWSMVGLVVFGMVVFRRIRASTVLVLAGILACDLAILAVGSSIRSRRISHVASVVNRFRRVHGRLPRSVAELPESASIPRPCLMAPGCAYDCVYRRGWGALLLVRRPWGTTFVYHLDSGSVSDF